MTPLPPKQGLKQHLRFLQKPTQFVMTPLPPKQGLKQRAFGGNGIQPQSYDTTSTKTRIETGQAHTGATFPTLCYDTTSTKTRIETRRSDAIQNSKRLL